MASARTQEPPAPVEGHGKRRLLLKAIPRFAGSLVVLPALLLWPAGTIVYWEAWAFIGILLACSSGLMAYLYVRDPALLERRLRGREKHAEQRAVVVLGSLCYLLIFMLPGLDRRFGWSDVPTVAVVAADAVIVAAFGFFGLVLRENSFASRTVEVEQGQRVVTTGPYSLVRHPMYVAIIVIFLAMPVALGSWWAVLATLPLIAVLVVRIRHEEQLLARDLEGYAAYMRSTRHRLVPGVW